MSLGNKLYDLRKKVQLSQEEVAEKLEVTRQTVSKWETDQSTPDFDKIVPICELYGITPNELIFDIEEETSKEESKNDPFSDEDFRRGKRAKGISLGVFLYFIGMVWIMISVPVLRIDPIVASSILMLIWGFATYSIVYVSILYKSKERNSIEEQNRSLRKRIMRILALITCVIYLFISFWTMAWYITWIMWVVLGLVDEILRLIFMLRSCDYEK